MFGLCVFLESTSDGYLFTLSHRDYPARPLQTAEGHKQVLVEEQVNEPEML